MTNKLWEGSSDIFTDYEGTVTDATFENGQYGVQMKLTFDEIDGREEPVFEFYSIPESWESPDGGETIQRVDGKDPREAPLKKSNAWQRFISAAVKCGGDELIDLLGEDAPITASAWIGTRWRMEAVEGKEYTDRDTKEKKKAKDKNFPVAFLGKDEVSTQTNGSGEVSNLDILATLNNPMVANQLVELAKTNDYASWFNEGYKAIQSAGITPNSIPDLLNAMSQPKLYEELRGK